jgi:hypothetical protein
MNSLKRKKFAPRPSPKALGKQPARPSQLPSSSSTAEIPPLLEQLLDRPYAAYSSEEDDIGSLILLLN